LKQAVSAAGNIPEKDDEPDGDWIGGAGLIWALVAIAMDFGVVIAALHRAGLS